MVEEELVYGDSSCEEKEGKFREVWVDNIPVKTLILKSAEAAMEDMFKDTKIKISIPD